MELHEMILAEMKSDIEAIEELEAELNEWTDDEMEHEVDALERELSAWTDEDIKDFGRIIADVVR